MNRQDGETFGSPTKHAGSKNALRKTRPRPQLSRESIRNRTALRRFQVSPTLAIINSPTRQH